MKITHTNGNARNGIRQSRVSVYLDDGALVDRFPIPARGGVWYCEKWPNGQYGRRYYEAIAKAEALEARL